MRIKKLEFLPPTIDGDHEKNLTILVEFYQKKKCLICVHLMKSKFHFIPFRYIDNIAVIYIYLLLLLKVQTRNFHCNLIEILEMKIIFKKQLTKRRRDFIARVYVAKNYQSKIHNIIKFTLGDKSLPFPS